MRAETFSSDGSGAYGDFARFSGGYRTSIQALTELGIVPALQRFGLSVEQVRVLEVGTGNGRSAWAIAAALEKLHGLSNVRIFRTEPDEKLFAEAKAAVASGSDRELFPSEVRSPAEALPFASNSAHLVVGSQVLHWMDGEQVQQSLREAHRVLKPGGTLVHATSGIMDLGRLTNMHHFTRHPFVRVFYLSALEAELTRRGHWARARDGVFEPWNPQVNPAYHRYGLADVRQWLRAAGFSDLNIAMRISMFPCNTKEMEARLATNFTALEMHFFQSERLKAIAKEEKIAMAAAAFDAAKRKVPDMFAYFDSQNLQVTIGSVSGMTWGEPVPVIVATK